MSTTPRVALFVETSRAYGRGVLKGIWQHVQEHGRWSILFRPRGLEEPTPAWMASWRGDGIIAHVTNLRTAALLKRSAAPCLDVLGDIQNTGFPVVKTDYQRIAEMAFSHLAGLGLQNLAICGLRRGHRPRLDERCDAFQVLAEEAGYDVKLFQPRGGGPYGPSWAKEQKQVVDWVRSLPKPIGIFACNDIRGREVLDACATANIPVPEQVAVIGVGNDELLCELNDQRLTSIDVNPIRVGYQSADLLCRMMAGQSVPAKFNVTPRRVVERQSTDMLAVEDPEVANAVKYIRLYACDAIDVNDVVQEVSLGRRVLERRFRALLGRSLKSEIVRVRLTRARELLIETTLSATAISYRCGFSSPAYFMDHFHKKVGVTAIEFRESARREQDPDTPEELE
ncbi:Xylose operon regulatory protein [Novipirellula galeiformis]|uniref:Xylose operon regulatory protein n=1 Tax=Novipirellula galeiformis TaxID=2528004 RepID=A0A5C6CTF2_9BACT|nr:DNA-binding transcriptional regulator [Novipirellula galeiformis]TWU26701.1 Xylose operon regulatory protein [Novipirellula galeiformis]